MLLIHLEKQPVMTKVEYALGLCKNDDVEENKHCLPQQCFPVEDKDNILTGPCCTHEPFGHTSHHYGLWGSQQGRPRMILPPPSAAGTTPSATVKAGHQEGRLLVSANSMPPYPVTKVCGVFSNWALPRRSGGQFRAGTVKWIALRRSLGHPDYQLVVRFPKHLALNFSFTAYGFSEYHYSLHSFI